MTAIAPASTTPAGGLPQQFSVAAAKFDAAARELELDQDIPQDYMSKARAATAYAYDGIAAINYLVDIRPDASDIGKAAVAATRSAVYGAELLQECLPGNRNLSDLFFRAQQEFRAAAAALRP